MLLLEFVSVSIPECFALRYIHLETKQTKLSNTFIASVYIVVSRALYCHIIFMSNVDIPTDELVCGGILQCVGASKWCV